MNSSKQANQIKSNGQPTYSLFTNQLADNNMKDKAAVLARNQRYQSRKVQFEKGKHNGTNAGISGTKSTS
jgi:hypothetical protein